MRIVLLSAVAVLALAAAACGGSPSASPAVPSGGAEAAAHGALPAGAKKPGEAQVGDQTVCPVSGEPFKVTESSPKTEYKGKTVYFCCPGCLEKFNASPDEFMKKYEGS